MAYTKANFIKARHLKFVNVNNNCFNKKMNSKKILVLGGSGFLGTNLLQKLIKRNKNITATYFKNKKFKKLRGVKYKKVNLENIEECRKITKNKEIVIMCAANSSGAAIIKKDPLSHLDSNVIMNLNTLKACYFNKVKKFVFISSNTVYPQSKKSMKEDDINYELYKSYFIVGWMKLFSEKLCEIYSKKLKNKMVTLIIRPGNLYGPFDKFDIIKSKVIPSLIRKFCNKNEKVDVWGDGKDIKDFLYIDDFCDVLIKIINKSKTHNTYNVASGKSVSINHIISILSKLTTNKKKIKYSRNMPTMIPFRKISISKIKKEFGFKENTSLSQGLNYTLQWYKKNIL